MLRTLDQVGASMYLSQARQLVDSLLYRIGILETARAEWLTQNAIASDQARAERDEFSHAIFSEALNAVTAQQTVIFDALEALLAAWAQLSLLFHPIQGKGEIAQWREARGAILRSLLCLPENSLLANRAFRDSWMHFDERLDQAFLSGWLGNRQQFVRSDRVPAAVTLSVRVIDVEGLTFYFRTKNGAQENVSVTDMKNLLVTIEHNLQTAGPRLAKLPLNVQPDQT